MARAVYLIKRKAGEWAWSGVSCTRKGGTLHRQMTSGYFLRPSDQRTAAAFLTHSYYLTAVNAYKSQLDNHCQVYE